MRSPGPACSRWTRRRLPAPWRSAIPRAPPPGRLRLRTLDGSVEQSAGRVPEPSFAAAAIVAVHRLSVLVLDRPIRVRARDAHDPSPSLPGVVAPSSTPSRLSPEPTPSAVTDPAGAWIATGSMGTPRSDHRYVRLLDGRVLVLGGANRDENDTSAELYDPATGTWSATENMIRPRGGFPATLLRDGRVLVGDGGDPNADDEARWNLGAEVYDPTSGTWTATEKMISADQGCKSHVAARRHGARDGQQGAQLYDPDSGTWTATGRMPGRTLPATPPSCYRMAGCSWRAATFLTNSVMPSTAFRNRSSFTNRPRRPGSRRRP